MVEMVETDPFIPIAWQKDHTGMQGTKYFTEDFDISYIESLWLNARDKAVESAKALRNISGFKGDDKVTKQLCNRILEPFMWHTVILSGTEFENFFEQRCPKYNDLYEEKYHRNWKRFLNSIEDSATFGALCDCDEVTKLANNKGSAEIHMMKLAELMYDEYENNKPSLLEDGEWHIPFEKECLEYLPKDLLRNRFTGEPNNMELLKLSTALCARISYLRQDVFEGYRGLFDKLETSGHWSPFEHCAQAMEIKYRAFVDIAMKVDENIPYVQEKLSNQYRNFTGFKQLRQILEERK